MKKINLIINDVEFVFTPTVADFNCYVNETMPDNKVAPQYAYLKRTVDNEGKKALCNLLDTVPGLINEVFATVAKASKEGVTVTLKN